MINDKSLLTQTLARLYAEQGHLQKAAQIYRHLLETSPDRPEYLEALEEIENRLAADGQQTDQTLLRLITTWYDLEIGYARLKRLEALRTQTKSAALKDG
jgi:hypothetical protein